MNVRGIVVAAAVALLLASGSAMARGHGGGHGTGGHGHGPGHGGGWHHGRPPVFFRGFVYSPWFWDPFYFPYAYPSYVLPADDGATAPDTENEAEDPLDASYGLVQLRGVPEGATVELDGRYWLSATRLDERWLALPRGGHTITIRPDADTSVERRVDVEPGTNAVVRFDTGR